MQAGTKVGLKSADDIAGGIGDAAAAAARGLSPDDLAKLTRQLDNLDPEALKSLRKLDDLGDAADAGKAAKKKSSFLADNATTLLATGVAAGGLYYLEQKYDKAKEETKNCMKVCLPENWDDHAYGDLQKSDLIYKEI